MHIIKAIIIDKQYTQFTHDTDLFESNEAVASQMLTIKYKKKFEEKNLNLLLEEFPKLNPELEIIAVFDNKKAYYRNNKIAWISDGVRKIGLSNFITLKMLTDFQKTLDE